MLNKILKNGFYWIILSKVFRCLLNPKHKKNRRVEKGKVCMLLSSTNMLGDLIIHNFLVQQLEDYGYSVFYGLSCSFHEKNKFFLEDHSLTKKFIILPRSKWKWLGFILKIKKEKINAVIVDDYPLLSAVFFYLAGVPVIMGSETSNSLFYSKPFLFDKLNTHYSDLVHILLDSFGDTSERTKHTHQPFFPFTKCDNEEFNNSDNNSIVLHIGGGTYWNRRWPIEKYKEICARYLSLFSGKIFLIGGKDEYCLNEKLKNELLSDLKTEGRVLNYCGADLNKTATIISSASLFIGNDSGPLHLAVALNKRVIGIYGPSAINVFSPSKYDKRNMTIFLNMACSPCNSAQCKLAEDQKLSCLTDISPNVVWSKILNTLKKEQLVF